MNEQNTFEEIVNDLGNGLQALGANVEHQIAELTGGKEEFSWDPSKIKWENAEGSNGRYERSENVNNLNFKAMVKDLAAHQGKLTREGFFYWLFENSAVAGRKKRK